jgi:hypothetical protein
MLTYGEWYELNSKDCWDDHEAMAGYIEYIQHIINQNRS